MKLETFFEKFDQFADAPDAVAKMRELVLQWAVQGRLVRQDSNEEPALKLIRDAVHARKKLVAAKVVRDETPDLGFLDQVENCLPNGWVRAPLSVYVGVVMGQSPPSSAYNDSGEGLPFYQGKSQFGKIYPTATDWCTEPTKIGEPGDVVISVRAPVGPTNMLREKSCIGRGLTSLRSLGGDQMHLLYTLRAYERSIAAMGVGSTFVAISKSDLDDFWIPIPPLAEQKRIVAKVDELMVLCDRLEAQQQERETRHAALARASLARFADAPTPANLQFLFHPSYAIPPADLRKSILTLAVQGKLVPQDPNDEPAASLISQIAEEKRRLVAARIIREKDEAAPIADDELPFEVPYGWEWTRLSSITRRIHYGYTASAKLELKDVRLLRITDIQNNFVDWPSVPGCEIAKDEVAQYQLERSDILVARTGGTVGKTYLVQEVPVVAVFASYLIRIQGGTALFDRYLKLFLESPTYWVQLEEGARGAAQPNVNGQTLGRMVVSVPPLAEQRRIVAKVEQLMALVDELETQLAASRATAANLLSALVAELTTG